MVGLLVIILVVLGLGPLAFGLGDLFEQRPKAKGLRPKFLQITTEK
jgi:hypothetical protein